MLLKAPTIEDIVEAGSPISQDLKILFSKDDDLLILDVGACTGEDSIIYSNLYPNAKIIAFEPLPKNQEVMSEHIKRYRKEHAIQTESFALSDEEGDFIFYVSGGSWINNEKIENTTIIPKEWNKSSSLLKPSKRMETEFPWLKFNEQIHVKAKRLDNYLRENKIKKIDFMHLDVQGAELKVLMGMGELIKDVKVIWLEVENLELYENQPLRQQIEHYLSKYNFHLAKDTSKGKTAGDCLFIQDFLSFLIYRFFKFVHLPGRIMNRLRLQYR